MNADVRSVMLYKADGCTLARQTKIRCVGRLPMLLQLDDPEDGPRLFVWEVGCSYREAYVYLLSIGEVTERMSTDQEKP